jgi:hypothetical protein
MSKVTNTSVRVVGVLAENQIRHLPNKSQNHCCLSGLTCPCGQGPLGFRLCFRDCRIVKSHVQVSFLVSVCVTTSVALVHRSVRVEFNVIIVKGLMMAYKHIYSG